MSDFQLKPEHFHITLCKSGSYLSLLFELAFSATTEVGEQGGTALLLPIEVEVQILHLASSVTQQGWDFWLPFGLH